MIRLTYTSHLSATAESVWAELAARGAVAEPSCQAWPRMTAKTSRTFLLRRCHHQRIVIPKRSGCIVQDAIELQPRLSALGALLSSMHVRRLSAIHARLRKCHGQVGSVLDAFDWPRVRLMHGA
jgi:hypothetical protein